MQEKPEKMTKSKKKQDRNDNAEKKSGQLIRHKACDVIMLISLIYLSNL